MNREGVVVVIGLGEVGGPLSRVLSREYSVRGRDIDEVPIDGPISTLHMCFPYQAGAFVESAVGYIEQYSPQLVIVNSTVLPGTSRRVHERSGVPVAFSPVRGKHVRMESDLLRYRKFVSGSSPEVAEQAAQHFERAGLRTARMGTLEALEVAKLLETTYFGLLIAWAQEVERFCHKVEADYDEVMRFVEEIDQLPPVIYQPGYIGGHCVIPNCRLLSKLKSSGFLDIINDSNNLKAKELISMDQSLDERISPRPVRITRDTP